MEKSIFDTIKSSMEKSKVLFTLLLLIWIISILLFPISGLCNPEISQWLTLHLKILTISSCILVLSYFLGLITWNNIIYYEKGIESGCHFKFLLLSFIQIYISLDSSINLKSLIELGFSDLISHLILCTPTFFFIINCFLGRIIGIEGMLKKLLEKESVSGNYICTIFGK